MRTPLMLLTCLRATAAAVAVEDPSVAVLCHPFVNPACPEGETIVLKYKMYQVLFFPTLIM